MRKVHWAVFAGMSGYGWPVSSLEMPEEVYRAACGLPRVADVTLVEDEGSVTCGNCRRIIKSLEKEED